jgi:hypothetical protein
MNAIALRSSHLTAILALAFGTSANGADKPEDLLRFANGDVIHGSFAGVENGPRILWQRDDIANPVGFDVSKLRQLVFNAGRPTNPLTEASNAVLVNGDLLPGRVIKLTDTALTLETEFAGSLEIPRKSLAQINPNPHGGQMHYNGPFNTDGWSIPADPNVKEVPIPEEDEAQRDVFAPRRPIQPANKPQKGDPWLFSGAAYYSNGTLPLVREANMPDKARFRFHLSWKNRLNLTVAFHADFKIPAKPADAQQQQARQAMMGRGQQHSPYIFGNAYVLTFYSSFAQLWRCGFDEEGNPLAPERLQVGNTSLNLPESGSATLELRCDRKGKTIALFVNDEFALQWDEADGQYAGKGGGIGFISTAGSNQVRISEILVASWNGMTDSARSMESSEHDIVLLANGTDRFAGKIRDIDNGVVTINGTYAEMRIPLAEVSELHFAQAKRLATTEAPPKQASVRFYPVGKVSGQLLGSKDGALSLDSPILGKVLVNLRFPVMFDFSGSSSFIDDWNAGF